MRSTDSSRARAPLGVESLEARDTPAGNVLAFWSGGTLMLLGDANSNVVGLTQNAFGDVFAYGGAGTTVDGMGTVFLGRVFPPAVQIDMGGGNDYVEVIGVAAGDMAIFGGTGGDTVNLINDWSWNNVGVFVGDGDDVVRTQNVFAQGQVLIDGGPGFDRLLNFGMAGGRGTFFFNFDSLA